MPGEEISRTHASATRRYVTSRIAVIVLAATLVFIGRATLAQPEESPYPTAAGSPAASTEPAVALPLYQGVDGLPLAVQLIGQPAREDVLLAMAAQLEAAVPWAQRVPDLA